MIGVDAEVSIVQTQFVIYPNLLSKTLYFLLTYVWYTAMLLFSCFFLFPVETYCEVKDDFYAFNKIPRILFMHKTRCIFSCEMLALDLLVLFWNYSVWQAEIMLGVRMHITISTAIFGACKKQFEFCIFRPCFYGSPQWFEVWDPCSGWQCKLFNFTYTTTQLTNQL